MRRKLVAFGMAAAALFLSGCAAVPRSCLVDNGCFALKLDDPSVPDRAGKFGCRFLRAGWIVSLRPAGSTEELFHIRSLYGYHPAFGCTQEIVPELELSPNRQLKLGVGIIEPNAENRFRAVPVELFPWVTCVTRTEDRVVMEARQNSGFHAGYAYELIVRVTVTDGSPEIVMWQKIQNLGLCPIRGQVYLHPFFNVHELQSCYFRLPGGFVGRVFDLPESTSHTYTEGDSARTLSAVFRTDLRYVVTIGSDESFEFVQIWHNSRNCFALEPFLPVDVAPGMVQEWNWRLCVYPEES